MSEKEWERDRVRVALPNKGRLADKAVTLLEQAGLRTALRGERALVAELGQDFQALFVRAADIPEYRLGHTITPSPVNPLGVKGVGEAGTIGATPALANAVLDALEPLGIVHLDLPLTPERVWRAINHRRPAATTS